MIIEIWSDAKDRWKNLESGLQSIFSAFSFSEILAQGASENKPPPIQLLRAEESYSFLEDTTVYDLFLKNLKWIEIDKSGKIHLTFGGEYRARVEHFTNQDYSTTDLTYYSQRIDLHASLHLGPGVRLYGELYHGYTSEGELFLESDDIDLHQGFLEWETLNQKSSNLSLRLGRQEIGYGASRLIGIREGPNLRRSFDLVRMIYKRKRSTLNVLYGKEVDIRSSAFDNQSDLFDDSGDSPAIWGAYYQTPFIQKDWFWDIYYFGFNSNISRFNDVIGEETRHSLGFRSYGKFGLFSFNTEFIVQFGELGDSDILAYNIETDWKYQLVENGLKPTLGLKLDLSSGDKEPGDGKIQTFNPLFVNPAIYSLAGVNTPANLTSLHPNFTFYPVQKLSIYIDYALFYRTRTSDGLYTPPRFLIREPNELSEKHIGDVFGLQVKYAVNRNMSFDLRSSYFIAGRFIEESGDSENTFYIAPTINFKF